ncbi:MAG: 4Fe-4S dicluster domain-containing protein [Nitrososphaerales archaeon]
MTNALVILKADRKDSMIVSLVNIIAGAKIADQTLLVENPSQLSNVKVDSAIICHFGEGATVFQIKEALERNGTHPLAIELMDLNMLLRLSTKDVYSCTLAVLRAVIKKLKGSMTGKTTPSFVATHGTHFSKRDLVKYMSKGFKTYRQIPIVEDSCLAKHGCASCLNACPYSAITLEGDHVQVSQSNCVECGLCTIACPEYYIQVPTLLEQVQQIMISSLADSLKDKDATVLFTCRYGFRMLKGNVKDHKGRDFVPIEIPCVASFSHLALMKARERGLKLKLVCPEKSCKAREAAEKYQEITSAMFPDLKEIAVTDGLDLDSLDTLVPMSSLQSIDFQGGKREVLSKFLGANGDNRSPVRHSKLSFFNARVDKDKCNMCGACAKICVPEALKIVNINGRDTLQFEHSKCIACMGCERVCEPEAIKIVRELDFRLVDRTVKLNEDRSKCSICGKTMDTVTVDKSQQLSSDDSTTEMTDCCEDCRKSLLAWR